ncbi:MAG: VOC family protein [Parvularcula sp.]
MRLNQITIACTDYDASVAFYQTLGLVLIVDSPPRYGRFEAADGSGATLSLHHTEERPASTSMIYFDHASAEALDHHVEELEAAGIVFDSKPEDQRWGWREARLTDPAGNPVCLMYAGENRRFPPWRVGGQRPQEE